MSRPTSAWGPRHRYEVARRRGRLGALFAAAGTVGALGAARASVIDTWARGPAAGPRYRGFEVAARRPVNDRTFTHRVQRRVWPGPDGPVTANWLSPTSGNWTNSALWSTNPFAPNNGNPAGTTYNAVIAAGPGTYAVTLDSSVGLNALTLGASGATLNHTAGTLSIADKFDLTAGIYSLDGGTLSGGALNGLGGQIRATTGGINTLDDVTIGGTLNFSGVQGHLRVLGNLDFAPGGVLRINTGDPNKVVSLAGDQSVNDGTVFFNSNGQHARLAVEDGGTLTVSSGAVLRGGWGDIGADVPNTPGTNAVVNQGTISADLSGQSLRVVADSFTNSGLAESKTGGTLAITAGSWLNTGTISANASTLTFGGDWSNSGVVNATNATVNLGGAFTLADLGTFNRTGGAVNLTGVLDNTGTTLALNPSTGSWRMDGGAIERGTVTQSGGAVLQFSPSDTSVLRGVSVSGGLDLLQTNARVRVEDGLTLGGTARIGTASSITFDGAQTIASGAFRYEGSGASMNFVGPVTLGPGVSVSNLLPSLAQTYGFAGGDVVSQGTISVSGAAARLDMQPDVFTNQGTLEVLAGGTLQVGYNLAGGATAWSNAGILRVNAGTLLLAGVLDATGGLGNLQRTGGTIGLAGTLNNSGAALTLNAATGSIQMVGGTIRGGTVNLTGGSGLLFDSIPGLIPYRRGELDGVALNGNLMLGQGATNFEPFLTVRNGLNLNGTITMTGEDTKLYFFGDQTWNGGTIALEFAGTSHQPIVAVASTQADPDPVLTLGPSARIRGGNAAIGGALSSGSDVTTLVNQGTITSDYEFVPLSISPTVLHNSGTLEAINSAVLNIAPRQWVNTGVVRVHSGTLNLGSPTIGSWFRFDPGTVFDRIGGQVNIQGHMDNAGNVLTLDQTTGSWRMTGGSIMGGVVNVTGAAQLVSAQGPNGSGGTLRGVTLNGTLNQAGGFTLLDGFTLNGTMILNGTLNVGANGFSQTITGGTFRFDETIGSTINMLVPPNGTQTFAPGTVIRGPGRIGFPFGVGPQYTTAGVVNQGLISSDIAGRELRLQMGWLENEGTIEVVNGARLVLDYDTTWSNTGLIRAAGGGELTLSGKVKTDEIGDLRNQGGSVFIRGPINNTNAHLIVDAQTGSWDLASDGSIKGGQVSQLDGSRLTIAGGAFLDGVTFNQDLWFGSWFNAGGSALVRNGLAVNGTVHMTYPGNVLNFEGNQTFDDATIAFETTTGSDTSLMASNGGTLTLGPDAVARGGRATIYTSSSGTVGSVINEGRITADVQDQKISIHTARFQNLGIVEAINGGQIVIIPPPPLAAAPPSQFINDGTLRIGAGSAASLAGEYIQGHFARLEFSISGPDPFTQVGRMSVQGTASLDGVLGITLAGAYSPDHGSVFQLFDWSGATLEGAFQALDLPELAPDLWWDVSGLYEAGVVAVVPSPGSAALLVAGGLLLATRRRGRRAVEREARP